MHSSNGVKTFTKSHQTIQWTCRLYQHDGITWRFCRFFFFASWTINLYAFWSLSNDFDALESACKYLNIILYNQLFDTRNIRTSKRVVTWTIKRDIVFVSVFNRISFDFHWILVMAKSTRNSSFWRQLTYSAHKTWILINQWMEWIEAYLVVFCSWNQKHGVM